MKIDLEDFQQGVTDLDTWIDNTQDQLEHMKNAAGTEELPQNLIHKLQVSRGNINRSIGEG